MTMRRFVNRQGWERWVYVEGLPQSFVIAETPELPQGYFIGEGRIAERMPEVRRRVFHLSEWRDGQYRNYVYVEDHDTGLLDDERFGRTWPSLEREQRLEKALRQIAALAHVETESPIGAMFHAGPRLDEINTVLAQLPPEALRRDPTRCYLHRDCRADAMLGRECHRTALPISADRSVE